MATTDWNPLLRGEFDQSYWSSLLQFVASERAHSTVYPPHDQVFAALHETSFASTRVVILGQDPYHGPGQAHGLSFSVQPGVAHPPSLSNIFTELEADLGIERARSGCLTGWAREGVLLLNATLTVRAGAAGSHRGKGWEQFTAAVIDAVARKDHPVVFILWGASARRTAQGVDRRRHHVIESPHPSPLSAHRGFFGSRPFSRTNELLVADGLPAIDWSRIDRDEPVAR